MYLIAMVVIVVLFFGLFVWCSCTAGIIYYYKQNQQVFQDAYNQYTNSTGWEPMEEEEEEEEETVADSAAEEKRLEAEKYYYANDSSEAVPPPYEIHNDAYVSEQK